MALETMDSQFGEAINVSARTSSLGNSIPKGDAVAAREIGHETAAFAAEVANFSGMENSATVAEQIHLERAGVVKAAFSPVGGSTVPSVDLGPGRPAGRGYSTAPVRGFDKA